MTIVVVAIAVLARQLLIEFVVVIAVLTCHLVSTSPPLVLLTK